MYLPFGDQTSESFVNGVEGFHYFLVPCFRACMTKVRYSAIASEEPLVPYQRGRVTIKETMRNLLRRPRCVRLLDRLAGLQLFYPSAPGLIDISFSIKVHDI